MIERTPELRRLIAGSKHVLIMGHISPDGDCIGAMLAMAAALEHLGTPRTLVLPDRIPDYLDFLPGSKEMVIGPENLPAADLVIVPDCSDLGRLGPLSDKFATILAGTAIVNIDHHLSNANFGALNLVDPMAAAVCEQIFYLLPSLDVALDAPIATCLLTGLATDTQTFRTPSVTPRTMRVATALIEAGAPLQMIADQVYNSRQLATLRLWAVALSELEESDGIVWTRMNDEMLASSGASWDDSEALVNLLASVRSANVAVLFKEVAPNTVRLSLRSNGITDVAAIAREFGGGGHRGAAGCTLNTSYVLAKPLVVARAQFAVREGSSR